MENIHYPFQIPIYNNRIEKSIFSQIKNEVYLYIENNKKEFKKVWNCDTLTTFESPKEKNIKNKLLEEQIKLHVENYYKKWEFKTFPNLFLNNIWVNIAKNNDYQEEHHHGTNLFSGVIYINVNSNSGSFQLINPTPLVESMFPSNYNYKSIFEIQPQNGLIFLFPSWLSHRALPNKSNQDRISISFNINTQ